MRGWALCGPEGQMTLTPRSEPFGPHVACSGVRGFRRLSGRCFAGQRVGEEMTCPGTQSAAPAVCRSWTLYRSGSSRPRALFVIYMGAVGLGRHKSEFELHSSLAPVRSAANRSHLRAARVNLQVYLLAVFEAQSRKRSGVAGPCPIPISGGEISWTDLIVSEAKQNTQAKVPVTATQNRVRQVKSAIKRLADENLILRNVGEPGNTFSLMLLHESGSAESEKRGYLIPSITKGCEL